MLPIKFDHHSLPPSPVDKVSHSGDSQFHFFNIIRPFIELLQTIGNAVFLSPIYFFKDCFKKESPTTSAQKVFNQTVKPPASSSQPPVEKLVAEPLLDQELVEDINEIDEDLVNGFVDQLPLIQKRISDLKETFKKEELFFDNMKELKLLFGEVKEPLNVLQDLQIPNDQTEITDLITQLKHDYQQLLAQLKDFGLQEGEALLTQFHHQLELLAKEGKDLSDENCEALLQSWESLENLITPYINLSVKQPSEFSKKASESIKKITPLIEALKTLSSKEEHGLSEPLKLKNIGNCCYIDSVLQALSCVDLISQELTKPLPPEDQKVDKELYDKKLAIQQALLPFLNTSDPKQELEVSKISLLISFLMGETPMHRLREAIFKSQLHVEFSLPGLKRQHDAAAIMELFLKNFLPSCGFKLIEYTSTKYFPGLEFKNPEQEDLTKLTIPLHDAPDQNLYRLIQWVLHKRYERDPIPNDQRHFNPQALCDSLTGEINTEKGSVTDANEGMKSLLAEPRKVDEYIQWYRLKDLPPILIFHFNRAIMEYGKPKKTDTRVVHLPADGIIDLAKYVDPSENGPKQAKYRIKSFVTHSGPSVDKGHYITFVEINGKYYRCDDFNPKFYVEIKKEEFFSRKDPYLMVLERFPEEETTQIS